MSKLLAFWRRHNQKLMWVAYLDVVLAVLATFAEQRQLALIFTMSAISLAVGVLCAGVVEEMEGDDDGI